MNTEKIWIMNCPKCSQELPQGLRNREIMDTMEVNCPKCPWKGLAKDTSFKATTYEDWMGPGYTKENSFLSQQDYEQLLKDEKGKVNLDAMFANAKQQYTQPPKETFNKSRAKGKKLNKEEEFEKEAWAKTSERLNPQQWENLQRKIKKIMEVKIDDPEAMDTWNMVKDLDFVNPEIKKKWEEALANKNN